MEAETINKILMYLQDFFKEISFVFVVSVITLILTFKNWRTNQAKLKQDSFERKYEVREAFRALSNSILSMGKPNQSDIMDFYYATDKVKYLFGDDVEKYRQEMYEKATRFDAFCKAERSDSRSLDERLDKEDEYKKYFHDSIAQTDKIFSKYLTIR